MGKEVVMFGKCVFKKVFGKFKFIILCDNDVGKFFVWRRLDCDVGVFEGGVFGKSLVKVVMFREVGNFFYKYFCRLFRCVVNNFDYVVFVLW